jgi:hypothetical protein
MNAINRKTFQGLTDKFGPEPLVCSENAILAALIQEVASENRVPFDIGPGSAEDESINKYFANSYAYVKFSK